MFGFQLWKVLNNGYKSLRYAQVAHSFTPFGGSCSPGTHMPAYRQYQMSDSGNKVCKGSHTTQVDVSIRPVAIKLKEEMVR